MRKNTGRLAAALMGALIACSANAQDYPSKPIRMVTPFAPGGGSDVVARIMSERMGAVLARQVVVDNKPGASGIIGADAVAKAPPDGYTILVTNSALTSNPWLYKKLPFDTGKDLVPVIELASSPTLLAAHPSVPFKTILQLVSYAKANPGRVSVGTPGAGQMSHLASEMLEATSGADLLPVHYKGTGNSMADLLGGTIMMSFGTVPGFIQHVKAGRLRAVAVTSSHRLAALPDVPTVAESYPGFEMTVWFGLFVPKGTPAQVVEKLQQAAAKVLSEPQVRSRLGDEGLEPVGGTTQDFDRLFRKDLARWKTFIQERNIHIDN